MAKNQIVKKEEGAVVASDMDDLFLDDAGKGSEDVSMSDLIVPFVRVLQDLSAQVKKSKAEYVEGAEAGMLYNTATQDLHDGQEGVVLIPIKFQTRYTEWVPRSKGGGLVADHGDDASILKSCKEDNGRQITPEGNEIVEAATFWCYMVVPDTGAYQSCILSLTGTQRKKARRLNTMIKSLQIQMNTPSGERMINPASFYMSYKVTTVPESNDKGDWYGYKIESFKPTVELPNGREIYLSARDFLQSIAKGEVKAAAVSEDHAEDDSVDADTAPI